MRLVKVRSLRGGTVSCPPYRELSDVPKLAIQCDGHDEELESLYEELKQLKLALSAECSNANIGKPIDYLSPRQAQRKLSEFTKHAEAVMYEHHPTFPFCF